MTWFHDTSRKVDGWGEWEPSFTGRDGPTHSFPASDDEPEIPHEDPDGVYVRNMPHPSCPLCVDGYCTQKLVEEINTGDLLVIHGVLLDS